MANPEQLAILKQGVEAWNEWRQQHPGMRPALSEANLSYTDLNWAHLNWADLSGADLRGADLKGAHLKEANLRGADLRWAHLKQTDLRGAYLNSTMLHSTTFTLARVTHADFTEARLGYTMLTDTDLSEAIGLETVQHLGPSTVSVDTIFKSKGKIPEVFLRGAGVPEILITYLPSLLSQPIQFYSCFISYSHQDKVFARRLHDQLQGHGIRCWLDEHQLLPGDDMHEL